jgi:hypothetical protein
MVAKIFRPETFQGSLRKKNYFEGWYFKHEAPSGTLLALIPGISLDSEGKREAFIQILDGFNDSSRFISYDLDEFHASSSHMEIRIGPNSFSTQGAYIDINQDGLEYFGSVKYESLMPYPVTLRAPGIMGWYRYVPFMECFHAVVSMKHPITGSLNTLDGVYDFTGGTGYIEKDWGTSFPREYIWAQCSRFEDPQASFMLSVATIPWLGGEFTGFLCFLRTQERLLRFATYTGARITRLGSDSRAWRMMIKDKHHTLTIHIHGSQGKELTAPQRGSMSRTIKESVASTIHLKLTDGRGDIMFDGYGSSAGFEMVGDTDRLFAEHG